MTGARKTILVREIRGSVPMKDALCRFICRLILLDKASSITHLHTTRQVLVQGNRNQTNKRIADSYHYVELAFIAHVIDPRVRSFANTVSEHLINVCI